MCLLSYDESYSQGQREVRTKVSSVLASLFSKYLTEQKKGELDKGYLDGVAAELRDWIGFGTMRF